MGSFSLGGFGLRTPGGGGAASNAAVGEMIEVCDSSAAPSTYGNGIPFVPLRQGQADWLRVQFVAAVTGSVDVVIVYAMSAANGGGVSLQADTVNVSVGGDPAAAADVGTPALVTPGNDALLHEVIAATLTVAPGSLIDCTVRRPTADDTHTGDMRVLGVVVRA